MPLRLPTRRRMGPTTEVPFRRRAPPTPQATRLMKVSLGAGLLFLVVLAAVFVPRALQYDQPPAPFVELTYQRGDPFVVTVLRVNTLQPLSTYRAKVNVVNLTTIEASPDLTAGPWGSGTVSFRDADGDGRLSRGDQFTIRAQSGGPWTYRLSIFHESGDANTKPPCPCAVGHIRFVG